MSSSSNRSRLSGVGLLAIAGLSVVVSAQQRMGTFRTGVDVVNVDVSVREGNVPVTGLTRADFVVTDNGVPQTVDVVDLASVPIDVSILIDTSGSMGSEMDAVLAQARGATTLIRPDDRLRVLTFAWDVKAGRFARGGGPADIEPIYAEGATALRDGLALAMMHPRDGDRRHLVIAYTDGGDNFSSLGIDDLLLLSRRTDSVLRILLVQWTGTYLDYVRTTPQTDVQLLDTRRRWYPPRAKDYLFTLSEVARNTGGDVEQVAARSDSVALLTRTIREFRESYVLSYRVTGVDLPGRHEIKISLARPGEFDIKARKSYVIDK
jgi:hypothetical protein